MALVKNLDCYKKDKKIKLKWYDTSHAFTSGWNAFYLRFLSKTGYDKTFTQTRNPDVWDVVPSRVNSLRMDREGNLYIGGDGGVVKFNPDDEVVWVSTMSSWHVTRILCDQQGDLICAVSDDGRFTPWADNSAHVRKLDKETGEILWQKPTSEEWNTSENTSHTEVAIAVDKDNNVFWGGRHEDDTTFLMKLNSDGELIEKHERLPFTPLALCCDVEGNIYVGPGSVSDHSDGHLIKFDQDLNPLWIFDYRLRYDPEVEDILYGYRDIFFDMEGNLFLVGAGDTDSFLKMKKDALDGASGVLEYEIKEPFDSLGGMRAYEEAPHVAYVLYPPIEEGSLTIWTEERQTSPYTRESQNTGYTVTNHETGEITFDDDPYILYDMDTKSSRLYAEYTSEGGRVKLVPEDICEWIYFGYLWSSTQFSGHVDAEGNPYLIGTARLDAVDVSSAPSDGSYFSSAHYRMNSDEDDPRVDPISGTSTVRWTGIAGHPGRVMPWHLEEGEE